MMSQRAVAKALGISRPLVQATERVALNKLRIALGEEPLPLPKHMRRLTGAGRFRCHNCGERGHNARACISPRSVVSRRVAEKGPDGRWRYVGYVLEPLERA
jgi:hypothetical protein